MRRTITEETWKQIDVAIAAGIGLREVARNLGIPPGTVLAHAKRKGLSQQIQAAKCAAQSQQSVAITPLQSVAVTMQQRGERYVERLAGISERVLPHLESMEPGEILGNARNFEQFDRVARRNFGLDSIPPSGGLINVNVLTNQAAIQVIPKSGA
ncbi:MAG: hypothetical protein H0X34_18615 [Chthoniobacterales bacterium]|nr:hypothetical protein [Chthoniobacterales bacterium]